MVSDEIQLQKKESCQAGISNEAVQKGEADRETDERNCEQPLGFPCWSVLSNPARENPSEFPPISPHPTANQNSPKRRTTAPTVSRRATRAATTRALTLIRWSHLISGRLGARVLWSSSSSEGSNNEDYAGSEDDEPPSFTHKSTIGGDDEIAYRKRLL